MPKLKPLLLILFLALVFPLRPVFRTAAEQPTDRVFPETGFTVREPFLTFFQTQGGVEIFGFPITNDFQDSRQTGRRVQYFQRGRLEVHPESLAPWNVQLGPLGEELSTRQPPIPEWQLQLANQPGHHYFPETGHTVYGAFLEYFDRFGGVHLFGYPISEIMPEGDHYIQWFQRARMEYYPQYPVESGLQMQLSTLGQTYLRNHPGIVPNEGWAVPCFRCPSPPPAELRLSASVKYPMIGTQEQQTVYIVIRDERDQPVEGAGSQVTVEFADGTSQTVNLTPTTKQGLSQTTFSLTRTLPGQIVVARVLATYDRLFTTTQTSFWVWW